MLSVIITSLLVRSPLHTPPCTLQIVRLIFQQALVGGINLAIYEESLMKSQALLLNPCI